MELEIKHLSPYLPYGLFFFDKIINDKSKMVGIELDQVNIGGWLEDINTLSEFYFPILRPLSDVNLILTELKIKMPNTPNFDWLISSSNLIKDLSQTIIEYCVFDFLCQNHFDVFNLIEKGLAIDINTLSANGS